MVESYQYDVNGMRVVSTAGDVTTHYVYYFSQSVIYEKDSDTNQAEQEANIEEERYYIFSHNEIMAEVKGNAESGVEVYYYHQDNLGSTWMMTSETGIVVMEQDYLPFGDDLRISGSVDGDGLTGYKYTGQGTTGVGLLYYKARYYDSEIGRFTREDEYRGDMSRPQTLHLFVYVLNNPLRFVDPTGYDSHDFNGLEMLHIYQNIDSSEEYKEYLEGRMFFSNLICEGIKSIWSYRYETLQYNFGLSSDDYKKNLDDLYKIV